MSTHTGRNSIENIASICRENRIKNILIVSGKKSIKRNHAFEKINKLLIGFNLFFFQEFSKNPTLEEVKKGINIFFKNNIEMVVAIGGGSCIDIAKLIRSLVKYKIHDIERLILKPKKLIKSVPLIAVPTTFGTGSEETSFAVVYINNRKYSLSDKTIKPNHVILDPDLCITVPKKVASSTMLDSFCQSIESLWSVKSNEKSKKYARKSIKIFLKNYQNAYQGKIDAIEKMLEASNLSGKAINITTTTAPHALSYPLTIFHGIQHGHAVALTLGSFFKINYDCKEENLNDPRGCSYVKETLIEIFSLLGCQDSIESAKFWDKLMQNLELENKLANLGINEDSVDNLISYINIERLGNNPVKLDKVQIRDIYLN
jgi:alcohol dehydrogenase